MLLGDHEPPAIPPPAASRYAAAARRRLRPRRRRDGRTEATGGGEVVALRAIGPPRREDLSRRRRAPQQGTNRSAARAGSLDHPSTRRPVRRAARASGRHPRRRASRGRRPGVCLPAHQQRDDGARRQAVETGEARAVGEPDTGERHACGLEDAADHPDARRPSSHVRRRARRAASRAPRPYSCSGSAAHEPDDVRERLGEVARERQADGGEHAASVGHRAAPPVATQRGLPEERLRRERGVGDVRPRYGPWSTTSAESGGAAHEEVGGQPGATRRELLNEVVAHDCRSTRRMPQEATSAARASQSDGSQRRIAEAPSQRSPCQTSPTNASSSITLVWKR